MYNKGYTRKQRATWNKIIEEHNWPYSIHKTEHRHFIPTLEKYMLTLNRGMDEWLLFKTKCAICQQEQTTFCWGQGVCFRPDLHVQLDCCSAYWFLTNQSVILLLLMYVQCRSSTFQNILFETIGDKKKSNKQKASYGTRREQANLYPLWIWR